MNFHALIISIDYAHHSSISPKNRNARLVPSLVNAFSYMGVPTRNIQVIADGAVAANAAPTRSVILQSLGGYAQSLTDDSTIFVYVQGETEIVATPSGPRAVFLPSDDGHITKYEFRSAFRAMATARRNIVVFYDVPNCASFYAEAYRYDVPSNFNPLTNASVAYPLDPPTAGELSPQSVRGQLVYVLPYVDEINWTPVIPANIASRFDLTPFAYWFTDFVNRNYATFCTSASSVMSFADSQVMTSRGFPPGWNGSWAAFVHAMMIAYSTSQMWMRTALGRSAQMAIGTTTLRGDMATTYRPPLPNLSPRIPTAWFARWWIQLKDILDILSKLPKF